jgi:hypothetical protein
MRDISSLAAPLLARRAKACSNATAIFAKILSPVARYKFRIPEENYDCIPQASPLFLHRLDDFRSPKDEHNRC